MSSPEDTEDCILQSTVLSAEDTEDTMSPHLRTVCPHLRTVLWISVRTDTSFSDRGCLNNHPILFIPVCKFFGPKRRISLPSGVDAWAGASASSR